jgi:hypothetical protein
MMAAATIITVLTFTCFAIFRAAGEVGMADGIASECGEHSGIVPAA